MVVTRACARPESEHAAGRGQQTILVLGLGRAGLALAGRATRALLSPGRDEPCAGEAASGDGGGSAPAAPRPVCDTHRWRGARASAAPGRPPASPHSMTVVSQQRVTPDGMV